MTNMEKRKISTIHKQHLYKKGKYIFQVWIIQEQNYRIVDKFKNQNYVIYDGI